ncbi:pilus assembly FimT family protein [Piscinibacter sakaiensis]|uniref:pilus assembly FimT family protein n=1 Tax=Piscinibacter sakaiensis TaxID=1547922 RepID=UPI003AB01061
MSSTGPTLPGAASALSRSHAAGFTLIEMIVVMVLLGLVTTLALPSMQRWYDAVQAKTQTMEIVEALRGAIFAAGVNRREIVMDERSFASRQELPPAAADPASAAGASPAAARRGDLPASAPPRPPSDKFVRVALPAGWQLERVEPAAFLPSGLCRAGSADLKTGGGAVVVIEVQGPLCAVVVKDKS